VLINYVRRGEGKPLLLVHGIWSSAAGAGFHPGQGGLFDFISQRYPHNFISPVDYGKWSYKSFADPGIQTQFATTLQSVLINAANGGMAARTVDVFAHSMGGLLTKTVVSDSGDQLWERAFQKRSADLELSAALRQQLDRLLRFQRAPFITRVVFIAVPHRGSLLAESFAGRIGRMLIAVPASVLTPVRLLTEHAGTALAPDVLAALQEDPTSIRGLSPQNPMIQALVGGAIDKGAPFHSIIRDRGLGDGEQGSDGVVPYKSSHLEGAESELFAPRIMPPRPIP